MEFNLTSFILEIVNFLALVWILQRLFYVPVKRALEERKKAVQKTLEDAEAARKEAGELQAKYENRLKDWEKEKEREREKFQKELDSEKEKQMAQMKTLVEQERGKLKVQEEKRLAELLEKSEKEAVQQSLEFTSRLLSQVASSETERRIIDLALKQLADPKTPKPKAAPVGSIEVRSAYPFPEGKKKELAATFKGALGWNGEIEFTVEKELLAGLEINMGPVVLRANLRDELKYFSEAGFR